MNLSLSELRRRGVLGAVTAYAVVAAGGLQLADIVVHGMDLPPWTMRALIWIAALGLLATAVISWFFDLTRRGFVVARPCHWHGSRKGHARHWLSRAA